MNHYPEQQASPRFARDGHLRQYKVGEGKANRCGRCTEKKMQVLGLIGSIHVLQKMDESDNLGQRKVKKWTGLEEPLTSRISDGMTACAVGHSLPVAWASIWSNGLGSYCYSP